MKHPKAIEVVTPISWAGLALVCVMLTSPTRASAASDDPRSSSAPAKAHSATAEGRHRVTITRHGSLVVPHGGGLASHRGSPAPRHGISMSAGGIPGHGRAPQDTQSRARSASQTPEGSFRAATGVPGPGGPGASKPKAMPVPIGGPRVQSRLGSAEMGRANHSAAIDGTQFRRRF
jgi:hypothetical protein